MEFPAINWSNLDEKEVQKALIIYNDRINTYRKMVEIDHILDDKPKADHVKRLAELRIRNILCLRELQHFNSKGKWLNKHPLLSQYSYRNELINLKKTNPEKFLKEFSKTDYNISRYQSYLNREKASTEDKEKWQTQLNKHIERSQVFKEVLKDG